MIFNFFKKRKIPVTTNFEGEGKRHLPHETWSIGIYTGTSPFELGPPEHFMNPVLTANEVSDIPAGFVADPFMIREKGRWVMFFEVLHSQTNLGNIGLATSVDGFHWKYEKIVLAEPFSLSYPYVFKSGDDHYLIPESNQVKEVRLYKAVDFPEKWVFEKTLLKRQRYSDSSVFHFHDRWWMFTATRSRPHNNGKLRLYCADRLEGPWTEHSKSPIVKYNPKIARPGGRVLILGDKIVRYAQDDYPDYGKQVWAFGITELTTSCYTEKAVSDLPVITGSGTGWNARGMHTVDPHKLDQHRWIACVDGFGVL